MNTPLFSFHRSIVLTVLKLASVGIFMHVREGMWHAQKAPPRPLYLSGNREKGPDVETYPAPWNQFDTVPLDDSIPTVSYRHMGA